MSTEYQSLFRNRVYSRKFDHDEARRRWINGETKSSLAAEYGVSVTAISRVCNPKTRASMEARSRLYWRKYHYDTCACGNTKMKRSTVCATCYESKFTPQVSVDGLLWCNTCSTYRPTTEFPFAASKPTRNFRHSQCKECGTKARQAYRQRRKVPCVDCGTPALPPNEKTTANMPRCRSCYDKSRRVHPMPSPQ